MHDVRVPPAHDLIRALYERSGARLWRSVRAYSGSNEVADEAVAEAFAQALGRGSALRDPEAWVWRTAFVIARGDMARRRTSDVVGVEAERPQFDAPFADLAPLLALSESDRHLLVLRHVGGYEAGEVAALLGVSVGAVRVRLHRARLRARRLLAEGDNDG